MAEKAIQAKAIEAAIRDVLELHSEDLFRGHLSNGCRICGPDNDSTYPCKTVRILKEVTK